MKTLNLRKIFLLTLSVASLLAYHRTASADPSKYPQFAQQSLPADVPLAFTSIDDLVGEIKAGKKPLIIDVRTTAEYNEVHILGAVSAPLAQFKEYMKSIPRDRPVVLY
jgi:3-mercaptopyruvate sulfurtransferase SseA